jgi:membrane protein YdbS with pleckstrin-like domain
MSDQGSRGGGEEPPFFDRDTEPIPRARFQGDRGRHAADDESAARSGSESGSDAGSDAHPVDPPDATAADTPGEPARGAPRRDRPRPGRRRNGGGNGGGNGDLGPEPLIAAGEPVVGSAPAPEPGRRDPLDEDDDLVPAGAYRGRGASFDDEPTAYQDFGPDEFDDDGSRYSGRAPSAIDGSFVVGEPITEEELGGLRGGTTPLVTSRRVVPLEDEPSPLVQRYLFPTEKFRGEWRRHPIQLAREIGIAAGVTIAVGLLAGYLSRSDRAEEIAGFLVLGWLGVIIWAAWQIVDWWFDRFILTNKRVMVVSGIITRNVAMMPLQRVTDMKYVQSALGRVLNYGTFELESAGQDQALRSIPHLPSPNELYLRIVEEMYEPEAVEARLAGAQDVIDDGT